MRKKLNAQTVFRVWNISSFDAWPNSLSHPFRLWLMFRKYHQRKTPLNMMTRVSNSVKFAGILIRKQGWGILQLSRWMPKIGPWTKNNLTRLYLLKPRKSMSSRHLEEYSAKCDGHDSSPLLRLVEGNKVERWQRDSPVSTWWTWLEGWGNMVKRLRSSSPHKLSRIGTLGKISEQFKDQDEVVCYRFYSSSHSRFCADFSECFNFTPWGTPFKILSLTR